MPRQNETVPEKVHERGQSLANGMGNPFSASVYGEPSAALPSPSAPTNGPADPAAPAASAVDVSPLIEQVLHHVEASFEKEMARIKENVNAVLRQMEGKLATANTEIRGLKEEREQLRRTKAEYERTFATIRQLTDHP